MRKWLLALVFTWSLFAGQSLVLNESGSGKTFSFSALAYTADWRSEFQIHDFTPPGSDVNYVFGSAGLGFDVQFRSNGSIYINIRRDTVPGGSPCIFSIPSGSNKLIRIQRNYTTKLYTCEMWNVDGSGYQYQERGPVTVNESWGYGGGNVNGSSVKARLGFFRGDTRLVPINSRPPVTADTGNVFEFRFDGNGNDSSGGGHNLDLTGYTFAATPDQMAFSLPATPNTPSWAPFIPLRAGHASQLASNSYSMGDTSADVSCVWTQTEGPSQAVFDDRADCEPTLTGLVFGPYQFRLAVKDSDGNMADRLFDVGAVAYDDNGVVIYPDERLYWTLGPQMVRGQNPWGWADERQTVLTLERANLLVANGGTVQVPNLKPDLNGVPLEGTVYWTDTTQKKTMYGIGTHFLNIFCGGAVGPATRDYIIPHQYTPAWGGASGVTRPLYYTVESCVSDTEIRVDQYLETERSVTQASPGVSWGIWQDSSQWPSLRVGTVYIANGSSTLYGSGTHFKDLWCAGGASPVPGAAVMVPRDTDMQRMGVQSCDSDTQVTLKSSFTGTTISSPGGAWVPIKTGESLGKWTQDGAYWPGFYDPALAMYREYYRSGDIHAQRGARYLARYQYQSPDMASWRFLDEPIVSTIMSAALDPEIWGDRDPWPMLRTRMYETVTGNNPGDQRNRAYAVWNRALMAMFDPDPTAHAGYISALQGHYDNQATKFQLATGGYPTYGADENDNARVWKVANGNDEVTIYSGPDIASSYCGTPVHTGGTASVDNTGYVLTGSGTDWSGSGNKAILLFGQRGGVDVLEYTVIASSPAPTSTSITLKYPWRGDSGSLKGFKIWQNGAGYFGKMFERVNSDGSAKVPLGIEHNDIYACTVIDNRTIKLDRAYQQPTSGGDEYRRIRANDESYLFSPWIHQPFMDGLRASAYATAAMALADEDATRSAGYWSKAHDLITELYDERDPNSNGQVYFNYAYTCPPFDPDIPSVCNMETGPCGTKRDYSVEQISGMSWVYLHTRNATDKSRGDDVYRWVFAKAGWPAPTPGDGCTTEYVQTAMGGARDKALGQAFGHGGGSTWPAARLGGQAAVENRTLTVQVGSPLAYGDRIRITATNASGVAVTNTCQAVTCSVTSDFRAGGQTVLIEYLNASSAVLARATQNVIVN